MAADFSIPYHDGQTYTPEEQKANRQTLCAALRSGKYRHGKHALKNSDGTMCCLGVALDLIDPNGWDSSTLETSDSFAHRLASDDDGPGCSTLPRGEVVARVFDFPSSEESLAYMLAGPNDSSEHGYAPVLGIIEDI